MEIHFIPDAHIARLYTVRDNAMGAEEMTYLLRKASKAITAAIKQRLYEANFCIDAVGKSTFVELVKHLSRLGFNVETRNVGQSIYLFISWRQNVPDEKGNGKDNAGDSSPQGSDSGSDGTPQGEGEPNQGA